MARLVVVVAEEEVEDEVPVGVEKRTVFFAGVDCGALETSAVVLLVMELPVSAGIPTVKQRKIRISKNKYE